MSHRKIHSQSNVPFSWEDKPGVSKVIHYDDEQYQYCPIDIGLGALNKQHKVGAASSPNSDHIAAGGGSSNSNKILVDDVHDHGKISKKVPPPPPCSIQPKRSTSVKGLRWWQEDPFLAAYKVCTKTTGSGNGKLLSSQGRSNNYNNNNNNGGSKSKSKLRKKISFSCKDSCDVRDDSLVRLSNLPPLPKDRSFHGRQQFV